MASAICEPTNISPSAMDSKATRTSFSQWTNGRTWIASDEVFESLKTSCAIVPETPKPPEPEPPPPEEHRPPAKTAPLEY